MLGKSVAVETASTSTAQLGLYLRKKVDRWGRRELRSGRKHLSVSAELVAQLGVRCEHSLESLALIGR
jgi:hypothetical protein